jgi:hypothetical protein
MMSRRLRFSLTAAILVSAAIPLAAAQRSSFSEDAVPASAIAGFLAAIDDYVARGWERRDVDPEALCLPDDAYGVRNAPLAHDGAVGEGHLFTPQVARVFRARIAGALRWQEHRRDRTVAMLNREEWTAPPLVVGAPPPAPASDAMIWLIELLPALPPELEYRRVARDLVLVDRRANVVVDVLRAAVPLY